FYSDGGSMKKTLPLLLIVTAFIAGCGTFGEKKTDEEVVAQRGQEWIDALVQKDFAKAWAFTSPGYRASNTVADYKPRVAGAANWSSGVFKMADCDESRCEVKFVIEYSLPRFQ